VTEVLIAISIIALLLSLTIPGVQITRSSGRALSCKNNLRQIGYAIQQYLAAHRQFPKATPSGSTFVALYPYLTGEQLKDPKTAVRPAVLVCPESVTIAAHPNGTCYAENRGICHEPEGRMPFHSYPEFDGPILHFFSGAIITPASIVDGLSNTACYAEILPLPHPNRKVFSEDHHSSRRCGNPNAQMALCESFTYSETTYPLGRGKSWRFAAPDHTGYVHVMPPNGKDCSFAPVAASDHSGGVHSLLCDGSVKFVSNSIAAPMWHGFGSRNGKEVLLEF